MTIDASHLQPFWHLLTRLGESQILLPAALLAMLALARHADSRPLACWWLGSLALTTLLTTASKVLFIGWGIGSAALDFTGISGHAMFAAAVYPLLLGTLAAPLSPRGQQIAVAGGFALALMVGVSRLEVGVHSVSEVVAGLLLGAAASITAMARTSLPRALMGSTVTALVALWVLLTPLHIPPLPTHSLVTRLALALSGHAAPHTRHGMLSGFHGR
ncbi:MAG: phosphatase PAP2 family protein [Rhodoferax sp.]|uniref:phosphatase PAP2 family protein n=1 Tax=Rhodoferax sp. TaxID=50421 RepID=UPI00262E4D4D|nr:phosphatase PAP2 family protein [Rhodoferax sp.]MDD5336722.1 phosphatase PAP2 family protein [Rhodoferax sp.]